MHPMSVIQEKIMDLVLPIYCIEDTKTIITLYVASYGNATVGSWSLDFRLSAENCREAAPRDQQSS